MRIYWISHWRCSWKKVFLEITVDISENFLKIALKLPCDPVVTITWLQKNFFRNIFQGFSPRIPEHLFCRTALTSCFWFNCLCTIYYRSIMTLQCVIHYQHLKSTSKIIPLNRHKFQILNQNREARRKSGVENTHEQQSKSIPPSFHSSKHGAHSECYKRFTMGLNIAKTKSEGEGT